MKNLYKVLVSTLFIATFGFGQTNVSGVISSNTTWGALSSPYIVTGNVLVNEGVTLTIEAGVEVKFNTGTSLQINGELIAQGTSSNKITFTSNQSSPVAGDWGGIKFTDTSNDAVYDENDNYISGSIIQYSIIKYSGGSVDAAVIIDSAHPYILNNLITKSSSQGIYATNLGGDFSNEGLFFIKNNTISNNNNTGIEISVGNVDLTIRITNNKIIDNTSSSGDAGGIRLTMGGASPAADAYISNNIIAGNTGYSSGGIYFRSWIFSFVTITNNSFYDNTANVAGSGSAIWARRSRTSYGTSVPSNFDENTFTNHQGNNLVYFDEGNVSSYLDIDLNDNNFLGNQTDYIIYQSGGASVDAGSNYWDTTTESEIQTKIYDWNDDGSLGIVDYDPYLTIPNTDAPISPPINVAKQISGSDVILTWDANPESDVAGYKIHYGDFTGYSYTTNTDLGNVTTYTLSGVSIDSSIAITAYDENADGTDDQVEGYQSWYSEAIILEPVIADIPDATINEDEDLLITLSAESQPGYSMTFSASSDTADVVATVEGESLTVSPIDDWNGSALITVIVTDENSLSDATSFTLTVLQVNDAPILAVIEPQTTNEDTAKVITLSATDVEEDNLTYSTTSADTNVTATVSIDTLTLTPGPNWNGTADITVIVTDGTLSDTTSFAFTVNPVNDPPVANAFADTIDEDSPVSFELTGIDIEGVALTFSILDSTVHGALAGTLPSLTFTPAENYFGADSFTFTVNDGEYLDTAQVSLTIQAINDIPVADTQNMDTDEDTPIEIVLTGSDIENDSLTYALVDSTVNGILTGTLPELTYTPNENFNGNDSLKFIVNDGELNSESAMVSITINPVNDAPGIVLPNTFEFSEDGLLAVDFTPYFNDIDSDTSLVLTAAGNVYINVAIDTFLVTFTADTNWNGFEDIVFTIDDQDLRFTDSDTVRLRVLAVNDAPVVSIPDTSMNEDSEFFYDLSDYITDVDSENLLVNVNYVSPPMNENVLFQMVGPDTLRMFARNNWFGTGNVRIRVNDGQIATNDLFILTVNPVNDAPVFGNMSALVGVGIEFQVPVHVFDVDMDSLVVSFDDSWDYPDWLSLAADPYRLEGTASNPGQTHFPLDLSDGDTSVTDTFTLLAAFFHPRITSITDVPDDQGGRVYISFLKSFFDQPGETNQMYTIFRHDMIENLLEWVVVGSGAAIGNYIYTYEVSTLRDSTSDDDGMTEFKIVASMNEGHFHSPPQSGYSLDNIAPSVPTGFMIAMGDNGLNLSWNSVPDEDFQYYVIDKSADSLFMTDQYGSFSTIDTFFNDVSYEYGTVYYRVSAIDYAGNRGDYSDTVSTSILALDSDVIPQVFALHQNYPNPFNPVTTLRYDLPENSYVNVTIYDMLGREIRTLVNSTQDAGFKSVIWDATNDYGKPVSAGVYLYQIRAGKFVQTKKMVLLK